jgi:Tol biopolymer transport system component
MGEVYRARDTRLDRSVAIKVLPAHVSSNPAFRERFDREARTISSLSHPHICALFDVGQHDGLDYLVMEFLDGESLATRLAKGPLPTEQVLRYGIEIAEALYAAHKHGIVHRDLKPGNVIITKSGAKLLDFGLAKSSVGAEALAGSTVQKPLTAEGTLLGTFQYMAPEQLEGKEADARTDIFAFGATLYEMATGKRAFEGASKASLIASILDRDPVPITQIQPLTPPALERVIRICLAKDPDDRWQSAHDIAAELRWIAEGTSAAAAGRVSRGVPRRMLWGLVGLIAGLAIGAAGIWMSTRDRAPDAPVSRFAIPLPPAAPFFFGRNAALAISPDGTRFVYRAKNGNDSLLYLRALGQLTPLPIRGTEGAAIAAFSPDGHSIAFGTTEKIKTVALDGGLPATIAETPQTALGLEWVGKQIYFVHPFTEGVWAVPEAGGEPKRILKADPQHGARALLWPDVLPNGKTIIVTVWNNGTWDDAKIVAYPLDGGAPKMLVDGGTCAHYASSGHLLYARGGSLFAVPFDASTLRISGTAVPVVNGVSSGVTNGEVHYAVSNNGVLIYAPGGVREDKRSLLWIDRRGNEQPVVQTRRPYGDPAISPDGRTVAVTLETATFDIWQLDLERDNLTRVSFGGDDGTAHWTPDGSRIIWSSSRTGHINLFWAPADNSGNEEQLTRSPTNQFDPAVSPDARWLGFTELHGGNTDLMLASLSGDHKEQPLLTTRFNEANLSFSPDGKWVVYLSDESGHREVYLRPFPSPGGKWQVSIDGARGCQWAHNGREVIYRKENKFFTVPVQTAPQVRIGKPQLLFEKEVNGGWDLSSDDQRILCVRAETPATASELQIVLNWFPELKRRAPTR